MVQFCSLLCCVTNHGVTPSPISNFSLTHAIILHMRRNKFTHIYIERSSRESKKKSINKRKHDSKYCFCKFFVTKKYFDEKNQHNLLISFQQKFPFCCTSVPFFLAKTLRFHNEFLLLSLNKTSRHKDQRMTPLLNLYYKTGFSFSMAPTISKTWW